MHLRRRDFIRSSAATAGALAFGPAFYRNALAQTSPTKPGVGPYGPLGPPDANNIRLPAGFRSRVIARANAPVEGTGYVYPQFPDGGATFPQPDGGWIFAVNSEVPGNQGGVSAIRFKSDGSIADAYRILGGTSSNCAGGPTPWGTWLSCEEVDDGVVYDCNLLRNAPVARPALGKFKHEAVCVDPAGGRLYLTEDVGDGGLYRFTPARYPNLASGTLEVLTGKPGGRVTWATVPNPLGGSAQPTRRQVDGMFRFNRGEGMWFDTGIVYVATTADDRIYAYDTATERLDVLYDGKAIPSAPLHDVDNVTVHRESGDLYVAENSDDFQLCFITPDRVVAPFLQLTGPEHGTPGTEASTELTGPAFDPSGTRLYFNSQRAFGFGVTYEITGPFRRLANPAGPRVPVPGGGGGGGGGGKRPVVRKSIGLFAQAAVSLSKLRGRGVIVTVFPKHPGRYTVALVARRGRRATVIARRTVRPRGARRFSLRMRVGPKGARELRRLGAAARVQVVVTDRTGRRTTRPLRVRRGR
jgi:hypothetical protein